MNIKNMIKKEQAACDIFNKKYPIGTKVSVKKDDGSEHLGVTESEASVMGSTAVIFLSCIRGAYSLSRVKAIN